MHKLILGALAAVILTGCMENRVIWNDNGELDNATKNREVWDSNGKVNAGKRAIWNDSDGNPVIE